MSKLKLTFDVGGTGTKVIVFRGEEIIEESYITYDRNKLSETLEMRKVIDKIIQFSTKYDEPIEIGIGHPGKVESLTKSVQSETSITKVGFNVEEYIKSKNPKVKIVEIENDARAAAYGEYVYGLNSNPKNMIHLTVGSALGMGVIINGSLYKGSSDYSSEISTTYSNIGISDNDTPNAFNSGFGVTIYKYMLATKTEKILDGKELFEKFNNGDPIVVKLFDEFLTGLSKTIVNLDILFDPDVITIGGGVSANEQFEKLLISKIKDFWKVQYNGKVWIDKSDLKDRMLISKLKNKAACYGMLAILGGK